TFRMAGYRPQELDEVGMFGLLHPDDVAKAKEVFEEVRRRPGGTSVLEVRVRRKDGIWIWVESAVTNLLHEPGIEAVVVNARDITERRMAGQWVMEANERLNALIQAAPVAISELDSNGRTTRWNPAATHMFGWNEEEVLGKQPLYIPPDLADRYF